MLITGLLKNQREDVLCLDVQEHPFTLVRNVTLGYTLNISKAFMLIEGINNCYKDT